MHLYNTSTIRYHGLTGDSHYAFSYSGGDYAFIPIVFPSSANGERIYRVTVNILDNDPTTEMTIRLRKTNIISQYTVNCFKVTSGDAFASDEWINLNVYGNSISQRIIDNHKYAWYLVV